MSHRDKPKWTLNHNDDDDDDGDDDFIADYIPSALSVCHDDEDDLRDPFCDPEHPVVVTFQDVSAAAFKIRRGISKTPCTVRTFS